MKFMALRPRGLGSYCKVRRGAGGVGMPSFPYKVVFYYEPERDLVVITGILHDEQARRPGLTVVLKITRALFRDCQTLSLWSHASQQRSRIVLVKGGVFVVIVAAVAVAQELNGGFL